ncbi:zinc finger protein, partial [Aphelenchoides avenae]
MSQAKVPPLLKCVQCGKEFSKHSVLRQHMETHSGKLHECDQCGKKYNARRTLLQHKQTAHGEAEQTDCDQCGKQFNNKKSLRQHMEMHNAKLHECDQCEKKYKWRSALHQHKQTAHGEAGQIDCDQCGKQFNNKKSLRQHMQTHNDKLHGCDQCGKKYTLRGNLLTHKRTAHGEAGQFECEECGKQYNKYSSLWQHMQTHNDRVHECDQCEKKYKRREVLLQHKQTAHAEPGRFECDECGKICPHKPALNGHKRVHKMHAEEPCECDVCGTIRPNPRALALHKLRAHSKATHRCEQCGKAFSRANALRRHVATHDEKCEEYRCVHCPRTFKSREARGRHLKIQHSDTRYTCDSECGLHSATRSEYLEHLSGRHARQHPATCKCVSLNVITAEQVATKLGKTAFVEADRTMKCTEGGCDFTTACARQMESHKEQRHHDAYEPALRCSGCEIWFASPTNLKIHNADKHQGERRFKCDDCGYVSNNKANFNKHQTSCKQGTALGNRKFKRAEPTTGNLDVKKESPHNVYKFGSMLGEGGFGTVCKAVKKGQDPSLKYAIKEVGPNGGKSAELEAKLMRQFEHKNLMALLEYYECEEKGRLTRFIVMEYCRPGSLNSMQKLVQFRFEEPHVLYVLKEVTCGLEHLHFDGVIHRDLKSANVLVNERAEVKISDFGVSTDERIA